MKSIRKSTEFTLRERGSKFYGFLFSCKSIQEFEQLLGRIRNQFSDASHHCTAYRIFSDTLTEFNSDDGEPKGTAGLPILNALRSNDLINCGAVVVRYFGGTKLGKTGLIQSYGETTKACIEIAEVAEISRMQRLRINYQYHQEKDIQHLIRSFGLIEDSSKFLEQVQKIVLCKKNLEQQLIEALNKLEYTGIKFECLGYTFVMK